MGSRNLNSGCQAYMANILSTELSPQAWSSTPLVDSLWYTWCLVWADNHDCHMQSTVNVEYGVHGASAQIKTLTTKRNKTSRNIEWCVRIARCAFTRAASPLSYTASRDDYIACLLGTSFSCSVLTVEGRWLLCLWFAFSCFHCEVTDVQSGAWNTPPSLHTPCSFLAFSL